MAAPDLVKFSCLVKKIDFSICCRQCLGWVVGCYGVIWVGLLVCRACLWPKSRLWPCERPVETPDEADLAVATTVRNRLLALLLVLWVRVWGVLWECCGVVWGGF